MIFDDSALNDNRDFLWDINIDLQHEIIHGLSVERRLQPQLGRQLHGDREHRCVEPANFDEFCITVPNDSAAAQRRPAALRLL